MVGKPHAPAALPPGKGPGNHCTEGTVGPIAGMDGCGKSRRTPEFVPRTVQPVASRYTDWAIPAHNNNKNNNNNNNVTRKQCDSKYNGSLINKAERTAPVAKPDNLCNQVVGRVCQYYLFLSV